ncbi:Murein DD-endopeptidase MepM and murein hydrolase activator NlpD, containing LysM domain [Mariprofundus ferrinatatus]|uniref:Murein DD-endopeptidase MepM and murein hydrolase activator NlpD, containing LysM domain n=1 Tax=Mariprofundus ferrinatatus TaxID=1921087 RepID=A0A2K8L319_9PROT|nr:M23 family metallopeptidase [Mariprofundus ferrinatatus]ATX81492.1 Murein DD-endopeptidase MepM and murein hydrolase activator NlpD, containing LysM domain [Mariprofundus ferrinatatus]
MKRLFYTLLMIACWGGTAQAASWQAVQGEVVTVEATIDAENPRLWCFGKRWPVKKLENGKWRGWIGIDLKTKPTRYPIEWSNGKAVVSRDSLTVTHGEFRISHIQVEKKMAEFDPKTLERIRREVKELKATYSEKVDAAPAIRLFGKPTKGIESTPFGAQRYVNGEPRSPHSGVDIAAPAGTAIETPLAGKVLMVSDMYLNGITVAIGHGNGLVSVFSHMQSANVEKGQWVETRQMIGKVGSTGRATGPHLHWGVRFRMARVDPQSLLYSDERSQPMEGTFEQ